MPARERKTPPLREEAERAPIHDRICDAPECARAGEYPAPKDRDRLRDYYYFCLDHVRAYNAAWNYYADMDEEEIESHIRADATWNRPSWPLGARRWTGASNGHREARLRDAMDAFHTDFAAHDADRGDAAPRRRRVYRVLDPETEFAFAVMQLAPPLALSDLKARYKTLVKRHHPDANGGDKSAEERLKVINQAYMTLKKCADAAQ